MGMCNMQGGWDHGMGAGDTMSKVYLALPVGH